jgi:hypothetical protein
VRGSQEKRVRLHETGPLNVLRAVSLQIRRSSTARAAPQRAWRGLPSDCRVSTGSPEAVQGGAASDTVWRVPCRWSQAILCWDSPQCCLSSRVLPPSVLLGATSSCWVASGSSCKIFLVGVAQSQQCASVPRLTNLELRPSLGGAGSLKAPQPSIQSRHCIWACLSRRTPDARFEWPASWDEPYGTPKL